MGLTTFLNNLIEICTCLTDMFISIMSIFMEPPLILYIGTVLFLIMITTLRTYILNISRNTNNFNYEKHNKEREKRIKAEWEQTKFEKSKKY